MNSAWKAIVTTSYRPHPALVRRAEQLSRRIGAAYADRGGFSVGKLRARYGAGDVLVVKERGLEWHPGNGKEPFFFHPGMSLIRAKRLAQGQKDPMLEAAGFVRGDDVIDCTAGLGSDAIVFSFAGGPESQVTALESEFPLYLIVSTGLNEYESGWPEFTGAMRRVKMVHSDHTAHLSSLPDRSVDIVYFDPMFRAPVHDSAGIAPLRPLANAGALSEGAIAEACRVARKSVVLKERGDSGEWSRFGFTVVSKPNAPVAYGVIRI